MTRSRVPKLTIAYMLAAASALGAPATLAAGIDDVTNRPMGPLGPMGSPLNLMQSRPAKPVELSERAPTLDEMIMRAPMPIEMMQPIPLKGVNISGLYPNSVVTLGFNYFVVVDNTKWTRMSDVYRESRLNGRSNFVTADSITHPWLAFSNRIIADAAVQRMVPDLKTLLEAMQKVAITDYRQAEDPEVRQDIERNIAYLAVAMRLLNTRAEVPRVGTVPEMVDREVGNIIAAKSAPSAVFEGVQDFSVFKPVGWYASNPELQNFYRCREWLSLVPFAITDSGGDGHSNMFRRSVLLFRSLDQANILGRPAIETYNKLVKAYGALGPQIESYHQRTLYPQDYSFVFQGRAENLRVTLQALAEPFFRTKLMLAVRNQKPNALGATSIFDLGDNDASSTAGVFRLFPMVGEAEVPWLRGVARYYPTTKQNAPSWPLALLDMYIWGSPQAGNLLSDAISDLDPKLARFLPELQKSVVRRLPGGQFETVDSRSWKILTTYFKPIPQPAPGVLRTNLWFSQRLLSAFGGWVDAASAIAPEDEANGGQAPATVTKQAPASQPVAEGNTSETMGPVKTEPTDGAPRPRRVSKKPPYHYLEPNVDLYHRLEADATRLQAILDSGHYFPQQYRGRLNDFVRLFQRLQKIASVEMQGLPVSVVDRRLLADIDLILDKVDVPLPAVLAFDAGSIPGDKSPYARGFNMAIGRPGLMYAIYQNPHTMEWTLGRGAVYTYYEMPAPLLTQSMWEHKIEAGFATPPTWSSKWELVQRPAPEKAALH